MRAPTLEGTGTTIDRLTLFELPLCRLCNRLQSRPLLALFRAVSWLGDWPLWVALAAVFALLQGIHSPALYHMLVLAVVSLPLYKLLKNRLARERPCVAHGAFIAQRVPPLDRYSFPSGHTQHAVAFSLVILEHQPGAAWFLLPFTVLVALSRVILGVHYPSDVVAGGSLGALLGTLALLA